MLIHVGLSKSRSDDIHNIINLVMKQALGMHFCIGNETLIKLHNICEVLCNSFMIKLFKYLHAFHHKKHL